MVNEASMQRTPRDAGGCETRTATAPVRGLWGLAAVGLAGWMAGCSVAEPDLSAGGGGSLDMGPSGRDGGIDCTDAPDVCPVGFECDPENRCVPREVCRPGAPCVPGQVCLRERTETSTNAGRCEVPPTACADDADCPTGRCARRTLLPPNAPPDATALLTGLGRCVPDTERFGPNDDFDLEFEAVCETAADCPTTQACRGGTCGPCATADGCLTGACRGGQCVEPAACGTNEDCHPGNRCTRNGCQPDVACDAPSDVFDLVPGRWRDLNLCTGRVRRFAFDLAADQAARLIARSDPQLPLQLSLFADDEPVEVQPLRLPGVVALDVAAAPRDRDIEVEVTAEVGGGPFGLELELLPTTCAADPLNLLGRLPGEGPRLRALDTTLRLRACPRFSSRLPRFDTFRFSPPPGERVDLVATYPPTSAAGGPDNRLRLQARGPDGTPVPTATVADRPGSAQIALLPEDGPFPDPLQVRLQPRIDEDAGAFGVPPAGVDLALVVSELDASRVEVCETGPPALPPGGRVSVPFEANPARPRLGAPVCPTDPLPLDADGRIFRIDGPAGPRDLRVTVRRVGGDPLELSAALLEGCTDAVASSCGRARLLDRPVELEARVEELPAFVYLSARGDRDGTAEVQFTVEDLASPVPTNDRCAASTPIAGSATVTVSTLGATDTVSTATTSACAPIGSARGPERFYRIESLNGARVQLDLQGPPGGVLWVASDCTRMEQTCLGFQETTVERPRVDEVVSGFDTLFVAVDAQDDVGGIYTLRVSVEPECTSDTEDMDCEPEPGEVLLCDENRCVAPSDANRCPGRPVDLTGVSEAVIEGSLGAATDTLDGFCGAVGSPELVYRVQVPNGTERLVARIDRAAFDAAVAIRPVGCALSGGQACGQDAVPGLDARPVTSLDLNGSVEAWVVVESEQGLGPFRLVLRREPAQAF